MIKRPTAILVISLIFLGGLLLGGWVGWYVHLHWGQAWARADRWPYLIFLICLTGGVGGAVNAFLSDNGFFLPRKEQADGKGIWRPGFLGNIVVGSIAAFISWGLYGPLSARIIVPLNLSQANAPSTQPTDQEIGLSLSGLVGAVLVGISGARWLSNEVDKTLLRVAGSQAASSDKNPDAAQALLLASPAEALRSLQ
jgi:hypothetical protein